MSKDGIAAAASMSRVQKLQKHAPRDSRVELLRIIAMLFIVACHGMLHLDWLFHVDRGISLPAGWKTAVGCLVVQYGQVGVCIFFAISGYFLVKKQFSGIRLFKAWSQVWIYTVLAFIVIEIGYLAHLVPASIAWSGSGFDHFTMIARAFMPIVFDAYWFMTTYIIMMCLTPFMNILFAHTTRKQMTTLISLFAIIGLWVLLGRYVFEWSNVLYACLGYMVGGWIREYAPTKLTARQRGLAVSGIIGISALLVVFNYVGSLNTPLINFLRWNPSANNSNVFPPTDIAAIAIAALFLLLFTRERDVRTSRRGLDKVILTVARTTFGVYLLHENQFGYKIVWGLWKHLVPVPVGMTKIIVFIMIVFVTFIVMSACAWIIDTLIVHPVQNLLVSKMSQFRQK